MSQNFDEGFLFDAIKYQNNDDLGRFLEKMTPDQGLYCLIQAAKCGFTRGVFSIEETEVLSKAIRLITRDTDASPSSIGAPEVHKASIFLNYLNKKKGDLSPLFYLVF